MRPLGHPISAALVVALAVTAFAGIGCSPPRVRIRRTLPPIAPVKPDTRIAVEVVPAPSAPSAKEVVERVFSIPQGHFRTKADAQEPLAEHLDRELRAASHLVVSRAEADLIIRATPIAWNYSGPSFAEELLVKRSEQREASGRLKVRIQIVDARARGAPPLYEGVRHGSSDVADDASALSGAARGLARRLVYTLRAREISYAVDLDDDDDRVREGIELCNSNDMKAATRAFKHVIARFPDSAAAHYNLGILAEGRGEYDAAERWLVRAQQLEPKPLYAQGLERVREAQRDAEVLERSQ